MASLVNIEATIVKYKIFNYFIEVETYSHSFISYILELSLLINSSFIF